MLLGVGGTGPQGTAVDSVRGRRVRWIIARAKAVCRCLGLTSVGMGSLITLTAADGHSFSAYRAEPEGAPRGGIVVVQEIFGVNSHIREVADGYAAAGYLAVAPALFDRVTPGVELGYQQDDMMAGMGYRGKLAQDQVMADVTAAANVAREGGRVGIVGFCFGGFVAAASTINLAGVVDAGVAYYGGGIAQGLLGDTPKVPLMLHFAELDGHISMADVDKVRQAWPGSPLHTYANADHGFECDDRATYNAKAARLALSRTLRFFAQQL